MPARTLRVPEPGETFGDPPGLGDTEVSAAFGLGADRLPRGTASRSEGTCPMHYAAPGEAGSLVTFETPLRQPGNLRPTGRWGRSCSQARRADPASILVLAELIADLLPEGVLNIVNGFGAEAAGQQPARGEGGVRRGDDHGPADHAERVTGSPTAMNISRVSVTPEAAALLGFPRERNGPLMLPVAAAATARRRCATRETVPGQRGGRLPGRRRGHPRLHGGGTVRVLESHAPDHRCRTRPRWRVSLEAPEGRRGPGGSTRTTSRYRTAHRDWSADALGRPAGAEFAQACASQAGRQSSPRPARAPDSAADLLP